MEDDVCDYVAEDLLKQSCPCRSIASKKKVLETGTNCLSLKNGETIKE
jgi:hypothetical protein